MSTISKTMLNKSFMPRSAASMLSHYQGTLAEAMQYAENQRKSDLSQEEFERFTPSYKFCKGLADRFWMRSLWGKKTHVTAAFTGETVNRWGDKVSDLKLHPVIDGEVKDDPFYWEWICWTRFIQTMLKHDWLDYDDSGSLAIFKLDRIAYLTERVKGEDVLILQTLLEESWKAQMANSEDRTFDVPKVKCKFLADTKVEEQGDPTDPEKTVYVTKAIRHTWKRLAKGLFLGHGKGFKLQQSMRIYINSDILDANDGELRAYLNAYKARQYEEKEVDGEPAAFNKSLCKILNELGLREVMQDWELDEAAYWDGLLNGDASLDGRERMYHNSDHIFTFSADKPFRALLEYPEGWERTPRLILGAKTKLARNLGIKVKIKGHESKIKDLPENEGVKQVEKLLKKWKKSPPAMPRPPRDNDGNFVFDKQSVTEYAEALWLWRIIHELLNPAPDGKWHTLVEWDAHASFAGLFGASCHHLPYLKSTNCIEADEDLPYHAFYSVNVALHKMEVKKGTDEAVWAAKYARGCAKLINITVHYGARYQATYSVSSTVRHPVWHLIEGDTGYLPPDFIDQLVVGGLEAYNAAKEEVDEAKQKVALTPLGDFIIGLMQHLMEELKVNPILKFIDTIKGTIGGVYSIEQEISLGKWGSIFMQTHHFLYDEHDGEKYPITTARPTGYDTVVYSDTRPEDERLWICSESDQEKPEIYRGSAREDTYWLYANRVGTWVPTGYIHHMDAVAADLLSFVCIKAFGYCLSIHDAFITSPEAYWLLNDTYGKILKFLWINGPSMWAEVFKTFHLSEKVVYSAENLFQGGDFPGGKCRTFK